MTNPYDQQPGGYSQPSHPHDAPVDAGYGAPQAPAPGPYAPQPYGGGPYAPGPYAAYNPNPQNQLALIALICSLAGLVTGFSAIAGVICGHIALRQLNENPQQTGRGMAVAALWVGYALVALCVALVIIWIALFASIMSASSSY